MHRYGGIRTRPVADDGALRSQTATEAPTACTSHSTLVATALDVAASVPALPPMRVVVAAAHSSQMMCAGLPAAMIRAA